MIDTQNKARIGLTLALLLSLAPVACGKVSTPPIETTQAPQPAPSSEASAPATPEVAVQAQDTQADNSQVKSVSDEVAAFSADALAAQAAEVRQDVVKFAMLPTGGDDSLKVGLGMSEESAKIFAETSGLTAESLSALRGGYRVVWGMFHAAGVPFDAAYALGVAVRYSRLGSDGTTGAALAKQKAALGRAAFEYIRELKRDQDELERKKAEEAAAAEKKAAEEARVGGGRPNIAPGPEASSNNK